MAPFKLITEILRTASAADEDKCLGKGLTFSHLTGILSPELQRLFSYGLNPGDLQSLLALCIIDIKDRRPESTGSAFVIASILSKWQKHIG